MSEHAVTVTEFIEQKGSDFAGRLTKTLGGIIVKPPIRSGAEFRSAVLGRGSSEDVDVQEVVSTDEATVFLALSGRGNVESRQADIRTIADRIGQLANDPSSVMQMIGHTPFPGAPEW